MFTDLEIRFVGLIVPLDNFLLIRTHHHYRWRAPNFDLCSALMAIEQWGFFSGPHLLRHGPTVYNGHLRGPVTLTPIAGRLAVSSGAVTTCLTKVCHGWDSNTQPSACGANALTHCSVAAVLRNKKTKVVVVIFYTEGRVLWIIVLKHFMNSWLFYVSLTN